MKRKNEFKPDWCMAPGNYLAEVMKARKISKKKAYKILWNSPGFNWRLESLFFGIYPIDEILAEQLEILTSVPKHIWLNLEKEYRKGLKKGLKEIIWK